MKAFALATLIVVLSPSVFAASNSDCRGSTIEMIQCMGEKVEAREKQIQESTQKILTALETNREPGGEEAYESAKRNLVLANEKAAEAIRLQCNAEGVLETATGSLGRIVTVSCILDLTTQRAERLSNLAR